MRGLTRPSCRRQQVIILPASRCTRCTNLTQQNSHLRVWACHIRKQQLGVSCHRCFNSRHRCKTRSAAVGQFAQHTAAAEIIPSADAWTDTAWMSQAVGNYPTRIAMHQMHQSDAALSLGLF